MKIIGLCGGSGSGKGTVCSIFNSLGIPSIDTDAVYHELVSSDGPCLCELACAFGNGIISEGALDRSALRNIVFSPPNMESKLETLNNITHKYVIERAEQMLAAYEQAGMSAVILDVPLLFESGMDKLCDITVSVVADRNLRIARIMLRDGIDFETASRRVSAQTEDDVLIAKTDYHIYNNGDIAALKEAVLPVYNKIVNQ